MRDPTRGRVSARHGRVSLCAAIAIIVGGGFFGASSLSGQQATSDKLHARVSRALASREPSLIAFRRDLHQHPEVSGEEERTARRVAERLEALGFGVRTGVGGHGVVAVLEGGRPGPLVAFRADMDAVPSNAPDPVEFRSLIPGVRHICGHDVHTTIGVAIAEGMSTVREELAGSVMLVFQPAEERATGARAMLADDVFGTRKPDAMFAFHTAPLPVGQLGTTAGGMMAGRDRVRVTITGTGDVAAAVDSVTRIVQRASTLAPSAQFQTLPEGALLAQVFPGQGMSVADSAMVRAQITTASDTARMRARESILRDLAALDLHDLDLDTEYQLKAVAGVTNDAALVSRANASMRSAIGHDAVIEVGTAPPAFSEDFGSFQDVVPGVMYFLGVSNPEAGTVGMPHSPDYVADEAAILVGARAMSAVILDLLTEH